MSDTFAAIAARMGLSGKPDITFVGKSTGHAPVRPEIINADYIETFVVQQLKAYLLDSDFDEVANRIAEAVNSAAPDCSKERAELAEVEKKISSGVKTVLAGMNLAELNVEIDRLRARKSELEDIILRKENSGQKVNPARIIARFQRALESWETNLKRVVQEFVTKIYANPDGSFSVQIGVHIDGAGGGKTLVCTTFYCAVAFVQLDESGDRTFSFYRRPGADLMLQVSDIKESLVANCHILHFGSVSLTDEPSRSATMFAVEAAKKAGCIISYDPNYRPLLWSNVETAIGEMMAGLSLADIIKVSEDEMLLFTGKMDLQEGSYELSSYGASLVLITLGSNGAFYRKGEMSGFLPAYDVKTIDTNGAGDSFLGAVLYRLREKTLVAIQKLSQNDMEDIISFANAAGSLATTKKGAIPAMPTLEEIELCRRTVLPLN